jgi:hypothetical protein
VGPKCYCNPRCSVFLIGDVRPCNPRSRQQKPSLSLLTVRPLTHPASLSLPTYHPRQSIGLHITPLVTSQSHLDPTPSHLKHHHAMLRTPSRCIASAARTAASSSKATRTSVRAMTSLRIAQNSLSVGVATRSSPDNPSTSCDMC